MTTLLAVVIDVAAVSLAALLVVMVMRRQSAALRHVVLTVALAGAALMPLLELTLPTLPVLEWPTAAPIVASSSSLSSVVVTTEAGSAPRFVNATATFSWVPVLLAIWCVGLIAVLGRLLRGLVHLARLESRSSVIEDGRWRELADQLSEPLALGTRVTILRSPDPALLVTYGCWRPKLMVPADADAWSDERIQMALVHELAHVRRRDAMILLLAAVVCGLHWFNPLVWLCARRLRRESECACDDAVLRRGIEPTRYAALLLSVARGDLARRRPWITAPAIAYPSTLERRIAAMLHGQRNRAPVTRLAKALTAIIAGAIVMPLAAAGIAPATETGAAVMIGSDIGLVPVQDIAIDPTAVAAPAAIAARPPATVSQSQTGATPPSREDLLRQSRERSLSLFRRMRALEDTHDAPDTSSPAATAAPAAAQDPGSITGTVLDQSGGALPGVAVQLIDPVAGLQVSRTVSDASGRFAIRDVSPGRYQITLSLAGFGTISNMVALEAGTMNARVITLPLGTLEETITVGCTQAGGTDARGRPAGFWARALEAFVPTLSAQDVASRPVRVGGNIKAPLKLKDVRPVCPTVVPAGGAMLRLIGRIGVDGLLHDVRRVESVSAGEISGELTDSALEAVRQWVFTPTLLNGQPVDVNVSIRISYR
jgi:beta-lactamase regulating signal transducer with metallopeptidase domain